MSVTSDSVFNSLKIKLPLHRLQMESEEDVTVIGNNLYFRCACCKIQGFRNRLVSWTGLKKGRLTF